MPSDLLQLRLDQNRSQPQQLQSPYLTPVTPDHAPELAIAYLGAYPPGVAANTLAEANEEIRATFANDYGILQSSWSFATVAGTQVVGAILVVEQSIWEAELAGPFVIDLFVDRSYQGQGRGRALLLAASETCRRAGERSLSLRVGEGTSPRAYRLYHDLGFRRWPHE
ncbi:GNAT family N-acetyltransferase [Glutamicibacter endophyticus]|uniref:GNAT family N-acetyltransferase n=1 Tax=Glutamicibacter endophyticus TaxID=1522174 RepID=UPI003AEFB50A